MDRVEVKQKIIKFGIQSSKKQEITLQRDPPSLPSKLEDSRKTTTTTQEVKVAVNKFKRGKSARTDGVLGEFIKKEGK